MAFSLFGPSFPFGELLARQCALLGQSTAELEVVLADPAAAGPHAVAIRGLEREGHATFRQVGRELALTGLRPLERADIRELTLSLEATSKAVASVAARASLHGFTKPRPAARSLAGSLAEVVALLSAMLARLERSESVAGEVARVEHLAEETDSLLLVALGELYEEEGRSPLEVLRWSHLYERLELALDGAAHTATILESIEVKHR